MDFSAKGSSYWMDPLGCQTEMMVTWCCRAAQILSSSSAHLQRAERQCENSEMSVCTRAFSTRVSLAAATMQPGDIKCTVHFIQTACTHQR